MHNLIEYSENHLKTSGSLWRYYRDKPALNATGAIIDFPDADNNSALFKFNARLNRRWWNKRWCWNNDTIKISRWFLENPWNIINQLWN